MDEQSAKEHPEAPDDEAARPTAPPRRLVLAIVGVGVLAIGAFLWLRGAGGSGTAATISDKNRETSIALVGAWQCEKENEGIRTKETLALLEVGRYTRQAYRLGPSGAELEQWSGAWEVAGDHILFTVDACSAQESKEAKPCRPDHPLTQAIKLPISDDLAIGEVCGRLQRVSERLGAPHR